MPDQKRLDQLLGRVAALQRQFDQISLTGGRDVIVAGEPRRGFKIDIAPDEEEAAKGQIPTGGGACCLTDELFNLFCEIRSNETLCTDDSGVWQGDGTTCDPDPCAGICCEVFADGFVSCDFRSKAECDMLTFDPVGTFYTGETNCFHNILCGGGGCCFGDGSCTTYIGEDSCLAAGGVSFAGVGVECNPDGTCP